MDTVRPRKETQRQKEYKRKCNASKVIQRDA